jgi:glutamate racemase
MSFSSGVRPRILVFDSGLGGLSVVDELVALGAACDVSYCADTDFFPYGQKDDEALLARIPRAVQAGAGACDADLVILACNTASTLALEPVRAALNCPVVGVVPAIKPAALATQTGTIGLLATPGTVRRPYTDRLIADFAQGVRVLRHGAVGLAQAAEHKLAGLPVEEAIFHEAMDGLLAQPGGESMDIVVLACTHYPLVRDELSRCVPCNITWLDSGAAIARRAAALLGSNLGTGQARLMSGLTTGGPDRQTQGVLSKRGFKQVDALQVAAEVVV